uniref:Uncharacterized protein n=1 Tax=Myotis myotis TaxID=51298 RepID=A0A7J7UQ37_MYOMY|nr:hypothetical protein mMyoMyo1_008677 [Myotis myotis]
MSSDLTSWRWGPTEPGNHAPHTITAPSHLTRTETVERTPCFRVVAQCAEAAPPVPSEVQPEEQEAELEASPSLELLAPPAASPAAAVGPGPAPDETEAPPGLDEEPSLAPMLVPAPEEELPVEAQLKGPFLNVVALC